MASNRHLGRVIALQTLYEQEMRQDAEDKAFDLQAVLERNIERYRDNLDDVEFIRQLVKGVSDRAEQLDAQLQPVAPEWPIDQIARMDRMVLRIGLYELQNEADVPPKVVINEAVELAKSFGGENSSKFVNGVLGTLLRQLEEKSKTGPKSSSAKSAGAKSSSAKASSAKSSSKKPESRTSKKAAKK